MSKIDLVELNKLVTKGFGTVEISKMLGCTPGAISQAKKRLKCDTVRAVVLKHADSAVSQSLDFVRQLRKVNSDAHIILNSAMRDLQGDKPKVIGPGAADPRAVAIKAMTRIEAQLKLQNETLSMLADMKEVLEFQDELISLLNEIDPEIKDEFIKRLREKRSVHSILRSAGPRSHKN